MSLAQTSAPVHGRRPRAEEARWLLLCALFVLSCQQNQIKTPTRVLDGPSDVALFCVKAEYADVDCADVLPHWDGSPGSAVGYLNQYCGTIITVQHPPKRVDVYPMAACEASQRRKAVNDAIPAEVKQAALAADPPRDPNNPCCDPTDTTYYSTCNIQPPVCTRNRVEALVTNTTRGEVAVVDTESWQGGLSTYGQIENLHSSQPGFGFLPVGAVPEHIRAHVDATDPTQVAAGGKWAVTANAGSCDLSLMDLGQVAKLVGSPASCDKDSCPRQVVPRAADGTPLGARPAWVEIAPWGQRRALVAFPACGLVADVDLADGLVKEAVSFDTLGQARRLSAADLQTLRCPSDCGAAAGGSSDVSAGGAVTTSSGGLPLSLALEDAGPAGKTCADPRRCRMVVADGLRAALTIVPYDPTAADGAHLGTPRALQLAPVDDGRRGMDLGVDVVRISPQTAAGRFVYAVARDATVRVFDLETEHECETNPDPRYLQAQALKGPGRVLPDEYNSKNIRRFACYPVGSVPRSPQAFSPGIGLPGGALPRDVGFVHLDMPCDPSDPNCVYSPSYATPDQAPRSSPAVWIGDFAWILASSGIVVGVQIADACPSPSFRACFPDQAAAMRVEMLSTNPETATVTAPTLLQSVSVAPGDRLGNAPRAGLQRFGEVSPSPRVNVDQSAAVNGFGASQADPRLNPDGQTLQYRLIRPRLLPFLYLPTDPVCDVVPSVLIGDNAGSRPTTLAAFPDPQAATPETWTLAWEGLLGGSGSLVGTLGAGALPSGAPGLYQTVYVPGGNFCVRGVEPGDKAWLTGCNLDTDCPGGMHCVREVGQGNRPGLCLVGSAADGGACKAETQRLMLNQSTGAWAATWLRRYRVLQSTQRGPGSDVNQEDRLFLTEIAAPEHRIQQVPCAAADYGKACGALGLPAQVHLPDEAGNYAAYDLTCRADVDDSGAKVGRCQVECDVARGNECPDGYVCARSQFEPDNVKGRCVRAPLLTDDTLRADGSKLGADGLKAIHDACFASPITFALRGGDAFVVGGSVSGTPQLGRSVNGVCQPAVAGSGRDFALSRLRQPRLRLGDRLGPADNLLSCAPISASQADDSGWIRHRLLAEDIATQRAAAPGSPLPEESAPSCQITRKDPADRFGRGSITTPTGAVIHTWIGTSKEVNPQTDLYLGQEGELFYARNLDKPASCVLSQPTEERCQLAADGTGKLDVASCQLYWPTAMGTPPRISRRCTDATIKAGAGCLCIDGSLPPCDRRIHYENLALNLVLQVPHYWDVDKIYADEWRVPEEGYVITFGTAGNSGVYSLQAAPTQGIRAQSLRSAAMSPDGNVYIVDQGRTGSATGLRGQLMRLVRQSLDGNFLVK